VKNINFFTVFQFQFGIDTDFEANLVNQ
jgi:hypothetical protein